MAILILNPVDFAGKVHSCQSLSVLVQECNGMVCVNAHGCTVPSHSSVLGSYDIQSPHRVV